MIELLILGSGWTSTFLIPLLELKHISVQSTSRSGVGSTIPFEFLPDSDDSTPFKALPDAKTVLIVFPITVTGGSERLVRLYEDTRSSASKAYPRRYIQLGTTSIWDPNPPLFQWYDRSSPHVGNDRAKAENELLSLSPRYATTVLNLSGLWGGSRLPWRYINLGAPTKDVLKSKGSIQLIHGLDVARAILAVHSSSTEVFSTTSSGKRWILTDGRVYDWWDLAAGWAAADDGHAAWVWELLQESQIQALPRPVKTLGRALDSREFWNTFALNPLKTLLTAASEEA